jgi:nitroimidazol reductase NimA-like FMN-containing flavoprotein (pyridoxamine 5'-phosphate oxidase superfamily)
MRRPLQAITDPKELEAILQAAQVGRLGLSVDDRPYVVPVSYGYADGKVYIHGAAEGQKLDMLRRNPRICFEVEIEATVKRPSDDPCQWSMRYRSVIAFGLARLIEDDDEKRRALDVIVRHYGGEPKIYTAGTLARISVIELSLEEIHGKNNA